MRAPHLIQDAQRTLLRTLQIIKGRSIRTSPDNGVQTILTSTGRVQVASRTQWACRSSTPDEFDLNGPSSSRENMMRPVDSVGGCLTCSGCKSSTGVRLENVDMCGHTRVTQTAQSEDADPVFKKNDYRLAYLNDDDNFPVVVEYTFVFQLAVE